MMNEFNPSAHEDALRYFQEGYEKQAQGQLEEAIDLYKKSIQLYPTAEAHTYLGWAYSFQGHHEEAIDECRRAIEIDPEYGNPYNDIGAYLIDAGKYDEAIPWLEKALKARRYDCYCYPHYNLGRIWEIKGDWGRAIRCYEDALRENAQYTLARRAKNRLLAIFN